MKLLKYPLASNDRMMTFEFISEVPKGLIHKLSPEQDFIEWAFQSF